MMRRVIWIVLFSFNIHLVASQCTLPLSDGTWISTSRGTWSVTSGGTSVQNFEADLSISVTTTTLECVAAGSNSNQYILKSNFELFFQLFIDVFTCIEIIPTDKEPYSYIYYIVTATDATTGEQFTSDQNAACSNTGYQTGVNLNLLTQTATVHNATRDFPDIILGNYSVVYEDKDSAQETDWQGDSCNDTMLMSFTHASSTSRLGFTTSNAPNLLQCLYYMTSGSNVYVFMYNNGTQDGSTSYSYTCWVFAYSGGSVVATAFPNTCQSTQTATSVTYGGEKFVFSPYYTCPLNPASESDEGGLPGWVIALIVIGILLLIAIALVVFIYCYMRKHKEDEEKGILKRRQPSPDSLRELSIEEEKKRAQEDDKKAIYRSEVMDKDKLTGRKKDKEKTMDLIEVSKEKSQKLQDPQPLEKKTKPEGVVKPKEIVRKQSKKEKEMEEKKRLEEEKKKEEAKKQKEIERQKQEEALRNIIEPTGKQAIPPTTPKPEDDKMTSIRSTLRNIIEPTGKQAIPPTTPKPEDDKMRSIGSTLRNIIEPTGKQAIPPTTPKPEDDKTLIKIKKERERKEKEKEEKRKLEEQKKKDALRKEHKEIKPEEKVHKHVRETSSSEYETDEEDNEERRERLRQKRKRLTAASYEPIDGMVGDASIIGRKKHRKHRPFEDGGDTAGKLMSREDNERQNDERRASKRRLKKMAKRKVKGHDHGAPSDSETDTKGRKKRRAGDPRGVTAPHIDKYYHKKEIEHELDNIHYWSDEVEEIPYEDALATPKFGVDPNQTAGEIQADEVASPSKMDIDIEEEDDSDQIRVGPNDDLPEGYEFDKDGNVVRKNDGKIVLTHSQVEQRRKFGHVFSLPRLIRNGDGRPLGGYKDDEFGPTAEWDWGIPDEVKETEAEQKKAEVPSRTVGFAMKDDLSTVPATPLNEMDANQRKGRQLGSADRELLRERLFEQQQQQRARAEQPTTVPIYFSGSRGVKDSAFIANTQIEKQDPDAALQRSQSVKVGGKSNNMIVRSDTFDDGRSSKDKRQTPTPGLRRGKLRASWTAQSADIPEETEIPDTQMPSRNIGSMDEFILVGGSVSRMEPPNTIDSAYPVKICPRAFPASRERSSVSDVNMRTAPDSPEAIPDNKLRRYAGEFLTDKRFFDQYIETEKLPTNAAVQTKALANQGLDFIHDRAVFWRAKEPEPLRPPPSDLGLRLMRNSTFYTTADSGLESRMSTMTSRPKSASDANDIMVSSRLSREATLAREPTLAREVTLEPLPEGNQNQFQRQYHGTSVTSAGTESRPGVHKVKVRPGNED